MARYNHTLWLSLCSRGRNNDLLISDRVQAIMDCVPDPDAQQPNLIVLIGNATKSIALRELFGVKRIRHRFSLERSPTELHLHVDHLRVFSDGPLLIVDGELPEKLKDNASVKKGHYIARQAIKRPRESFGSGGPIGGIYSQLLSPFANVFCFFCDDLGGLKRVARQLAAWLEHGCSSTLPASTRPRVIVVTEKVPVGVENEKETRTALLNLIPKETLRNMLDHISAIEIVALFPDASMSMKARYRPLKERLMANSDQVRKQRQDAQSLFSATHFAALLESACEHFSNTLGEPFNFVQSCRAYNPPAANLKDHLSSFLTHIRSPIELRTFAAPIIASSFCFDNYPPGAHYFAPKEVFNILYKESLTNSIKNGVIGFEGSNEVILRSGFVSMVGKHFEHFSQRLIRGKEPAADIHFQNLTHYKPHFLNIQSDNVCLVCLRRRPSYRLRCEHMICGNCVRVFGKSPKDDPFIFSMRRCVLCQVSMPEDMYIRMHPPTAGAGVLCIDGGGVRGIIPLKILERIKNKIDLPIPFQRFIKVAFGISSGGLIVADMFINGSSIEDSSDKFETLVKSVFRRRGFASMSFLPKFLQDLIPFRANNLHPVSSFLYLADVLISFFCDGLYSSKNIENALKQVFGLNRSILDFSNATTTGTFVGLPVATTNTKPKCRIFTNYNNEAERGDPNDYIVRPREETQKLRLWEITRAISAAQGVFPPITIRGLGTFQDAGPLENDPLISAVTAAATAFPLLEEPDFVVSLGTGEPKPNRDLPVINSSNIWKNGALPRLCRLFFEKMRDKKLREAFRTHPKYHRLNVQFDGNEPRLDDAHCIHELKSKAEEDQSLSSQIDTVARCFIASLFYFELDSPPRRVGEKYLGTGYILCSIRHNDPAFSLLFDRLSRGSAHIWVDGWQGVQAVNKDSFDKNGNFRRRVELNTNGRFSITLSQTASEPCGISGSPFEVERLVRLQGFKAVFGQPDHRKRKSTERSHNPKRKQRRTTRG